VSYIKPRPVVAPTNDEPRISATSIARARRRSSAIRAAASGVSAISCAAVDSAAKKRIAARLCGPRGKCARVRQTSRARLCEANARPPRPLASLLRRWFKPFIRITYLNSVRHQFTAVVPGGRVAFYDTLLVCPSQTIIQRQPAPSSYGPSARYVGCAGRDRGDNTAIRWRLPSACAIFPRACVRRPMSAAAKPRTAPWPSFGFG
jgi:hypothetical protein